MVGCKEWFGPNTEADAWAAKIKLVKKPYYNGYSRFDMENAPCWIYKSRSDADGVNAVTKCMTTYSGGCWYGTCRHYARVYTSIFQERVKGQYHLVSGFYCKARFVSIPSHRWAEVYIKDEGYYVCDVCQPQMLAPRAAYGDRRGVGMGNRWIYGNLAYGCAPFQWLWAGPEIEPPEKSYIEAKTSPSNASIWLRKH